MTPGQAQDARHGAALKVQGAWSGGCKRPVEMGGGIFVVVALTPYGGWFEEAKEWMSKGGAHGRQGAALRVGRAVRAPGEDVGVGLAPRVHATGDGGGDGECDV